MRNTIIFRLETKWPSFPDQIFKQKINLLIMSAFTLRCFNFFGVVCWLHMRIIPKKFFFNTLWKTDTLTFFSKEALKNKNKKKKAHWLGVKTVVQLIANSQYRATFRKSVENEKWQKSQLMRMEYLKKNSHFKTSTKNWTF